MSNYTGRTELPPIESNVSVRLHDGVIVTGVVTGHGQKDGKPTFDFEYDHQKSDGQILKASKWAWPYQVQRNLSNNIEQSDAKHLISATTAELSLIRSAVDNYRDLVSSPTSADRSANGDDWADREVLA